MSINNEKITFLYQSIADMQGTIRAIDTKLGIIIVILSLPFSTIGKIYSKFTLVQQQYSSALFIICIFIFVTFGLMWLSAFIIAFKGLIGIDNPVKHIHQNENNISGIFYNGGLYNKGFLDTFLNRDGIKSIKSISDQLSKIPDSEEAIEKELVFEQMKLTYIRDMKQIRHCWSFRITFFWLLTGLCIYIFM